MKWIDRAAIAVLALVFTPVSAHAQPLRILNLEVRNLDNASSCSLAGFRPELRITNWGPDPFPFTSVDVRMFFSNALAEPIEFVGADFARISNPDGSQAGFASAFHFDSAPPSASCVVAADRRANQTHHLAFRPIDPAGSAILPANGGFATVVISFRRGGGQSPFDAGCDDFTKLASDPSRSFHNDRFFNLVEPNPMGPPHTLICEFTDPARRDPDSGIDAGVDACGTTGCVGP
jgi:hypothetical protein